MIRLSFRPIAAVLLTTSFLVTSPPAQPLTIAQDPAALVNTTDQASGPGLSRRPAQRIGVWLVDDPLDRPDLVLEGAAADRVTWTPDPPAFPGDRPGSLTARFEALAEPGLLGFELPRSMNETTSFTAGALFVIRSEGFSADPEGFFQISWGLWNKSRTGLERTGNLQDFSGDTFELMEFDWFPNMTAFGGPFLSPIVFGEANTADPLFPFLGSFSNLSLASQEADLPLDSPLLAVLEHRPQDSALVVSVYRLIGGRRLLPVSGAVAVVPLGALPLYTYELDTIGLTLWRDGFSGLSPSLQANVVFHALLLQAGEVDRPEQLLNIPPTRP